MELWAQTKTFSEWKRQLNNSYCHVKLLFSVFLMIFVIRIYSIAWHPAFRPSFCDIINVFRIYIDILYRNNCYIKMWQTANRWVHCDICAVFCIYVVFVVIERIISFLHNQMANKFFFECFQMFPFCFSFFVFSVTFECNDILLICARVSTFISC